MMLNNLILKFKQYQISRKIRHGKIKLVDDIDLKEDWVYHPLMKEIRKLVIPLVEKRLKESDILFDPQDLEHQILFRLTTFSPIQLFGWKFANSLKTQINNWTDIERLKVENFSLDQEILNQVLEEQYLIIAERMKAVEKIIPLDHAFRGLFGKAKDLNRYRRLKLEKQNGKIWAIDDNGYQREIEFKRIDETDIISVLTGSFHYIHNERSRGETFAFFFKGDQLPWGVETTEKSCYSRPYKKLALLANGIHPDKAVELTRYYTLPGSPINSISIIDSLVRNYYAPTEIEALMTAVMPTYAKTKSSTIAGGINKLLLVKPLKHQFIKSKIKNKAVWQHATKRLISQLRYHGEILTSHPEFPLYPTFEVYITIKKLKLKKLPELQNKVISFL
ncbi:MAG: hypothetical protein ACP5IX_03295 [Patescibacteria group bacterium]